MKLTKDFYLSELVPKIIIEQFGDKGIWFINPKIVNVVQWLRDHVGRSITINNWHDGGSRDESGFRLPKTLTGGKLSQHKFGNAVDILVEGMSPIEVMDIITLNFGVLNSLGLTAVEDVVFTKTWNHLDCRFTKEKELIIVKPAK